MALTEDEKRQALRYAANGAQFYFLPSAELRNRVANGDPETVDLCSALQVPILKMEALRLDEDMVISYCQGTLDRRNTWVLDQGDIKVVPKQFELKKEEN